MDWTLWKRAAAYGVVLWVIAFLVIALFGTLDVSAGSLPAGSVLLLVALIVTWTLASRVHAVSVSQGLGIGALWVGLNVLLDFLIIVVGFSGGELALFREWVVWGRYILLFLVPILLSSRRRASAE
jgi:hypothetical protein